MVAISRNRSFRRPHRASRHRAEDRSRRWTGSVIAVGLFYFIAHDAATMDQVLDEGSVFQRSLSSRDAISAFEMFAGLDSSPGTAPPDTQGPAAIPKRTELEEFLNHSIITEQGKDLVRGIDPRYGSPSPCMRIAIGTLAKAPLVIRQTLWALAIA